MTDLARQILELLQRHALGRAHAVKADLLATIAGTTWRNVEAAVEELRNGGVFIASARTGKPRGLYIPATPEEADDALGSFRRATLTQITTYNHLKRARRLALRSAGQISLFSSSASSATSADNSSIGVPAALGTEPKGV